MQFERSKRHMELRPSRLTPIVTEGRQSTYTTAPYVSRGDSRLTNSGSSESSVRRKRTNVMGKLNRRGPALPGFR